MARMYPNSSFVGQDLTVSGIAKANELSADLDNVQFFVQNACQKTEFNDDSFDWVIGIDVIHDLPYPEKALKEIYRIIKKDSYFSVVDVRCHSRHSLNTGNPMAPVVYGNSLLHCMPMSYSLPDSAGLGASWGIEKAQEIFKEAGFSVEGVKEMPDLFEICYVLKKQK